MSLVAIVGRPNVGKSTLFNRLTERQQAIVHDMPGVTRDRVYGEVLWNGRSFELVDTGGFVPHSADRYEEAIREQVFLALDEAALILFVVDTTTGITDIDDEMADLLRKTEKPVLVVANKADNEERRWETSTFYQLGLPEVLPVSATSGLGTGDLLDEVVEQLPEEEEPEEEQGVQIAIIGRPNVGKSSLVNKLLGGERVIVSEEAGTTRDAIHTRLLYGDTPVTLVDTAGLRKKTRVKENVEFYATVRTERALRRCDVAVLVIEALEGMQAQDTKVLKMAEEMQKGLIIAVNKWDLVVKEENIADRYLEYIHRRLQTLFYVPVVFISALTGQRAHRVIDLALEVARERERKIPTSKLNAFLEETLHRTPPPSFRGNAVRIKYATQIRTAPPVFVFFCNHPKGITASYQRFLERQLREAFGFTGVPLILRFKKK